MAKTTRTLDAYLDAWESKRMSGGRALTEAEHAVVLEVGELVARLRLPSDVSPELVDILRRHQNDAAGALQIFAERFETSAIELDLYRRSWRDVHDAAFERLLQLRMSAMKARDASDEKIQLFKAEICSWRDQLARTRREREQSRADRARRAAEDQLRIEAQKQEEFEARSRAEVEARLAHEQKVAEQNAIQEAHLAARAQRLESMKSTHAASITQLQSEIQLAQEERHYVLLILQPCKHAQDNRDHHRHTPH